jgi:hypothetical protein
MRGTQLARQWKIVRLLEARKKGLTAEDLSSYLDVPVRTIYRDLNAIQEAGFPIYTERMGRRSHWKLMEGFKAGFPLPLTTTELMSLHNPPNCGRLNTERPVSKGSADEQKCQKLLTEQPTGRYAQENALMWNFVGMMVPVEFLGDSGEMTLPLLRLRGPLK